MGPEIGATESFLTTYNNDEFRIEVKSNINSKIVNFWHPSRKMLYQSYRMYDDFADPKQWFWTDANWADDLAPTPMGKAIEMWVVNSLGLTLQEYLKVMLNV